MRNYYGFTDGNGAGLFRVDPSTGVRTPVLIGGEIPNDLTVDLAGNVYVSAFYSGAILKIEGAPAPAANQPPVANDDAATTNEDAALAIAVLANDSDPDGDALTVTGVTDPAHGSAEVNLDGTVTYIPDPNFNGTDTFTYTIGDGKGGTATASVQVTVNPVNDAPSFTKSPDHRGFEDCGSHVVNGWAFALSKGPANESGQVLDFIVSNNNNGLFSAQPAIDPSGKLTYTAVADANGFATVTVQLRDNGGTANGGVDTSAPQTFTIEVIPVNDAPSFVKGADQAVAEDAGAQSVAGWATNLSAGPPDEAGQVLNFLVSNDNNGLFSAQPAVNAAGTLTYTPAANANGSATVTVRIKDNGGLFIPGCCSGGVDTSAPQTFAITVNPVNDAPSFVKGADQTVLDNAGPQSATGWATGISAGPADEAGQALSFLASSDNNTLFAVQPAVDASGTLTYAPAANANGTANVTLRIHDGGGTDKGGVDTSAPQSFAIAVNLSNRPPAANAGADQHLEAAGPTTAVQLDGSGSSDPDGDALSYSWSENGALVSAQASPTLTLAKGSHTFALTVADGRGGSASDEVVVTIVDTTPPVVALSGANPLTLECPAPYVEAGATASDACDLHPVLNIAGSVDTHTPGTYTLTYSAQDVSGNVSLPVTRTVITRDTTPPTASAALTAISRDRDEDEDEDGNFYRITATATDACDAHPVVSALITQPLTSTTPMVVSYKREKKNRIQLQVEKKKLQVKLGGPSESALRALWTQVLGAGGFAVSNGQQVQLVLKKDKTEYEAQYRLDKDLKLTSAKGPGLKLVVWAVDASGNRSANAEGVPAKSGRDDRLSKLVADVQPTGFALNQNYPNPFNPSTILSYDLAEAAEVRLTIYKM